MSNTKRILLVCGMGMSSGFLATSARKAAKKAGKDYKIEARSETEAIQFLPSIDGLLVGPHYASKMDKFRKEAKPLNVPVELIPDDIYGSLNGEKLIQLISEQLLEEK